MKINSGNIPTHLVKHLMPFVCSLDEKKYKGIFYIEWNGIFAICSKFHGGQPDSKKGQELARKFGGSWWAGRGESRIYIPVDWVILGAPKFRIAFKKVKKVSTASTKIFFKGKY